MHDPGQWYMLLSLPVRLFFHLSSKCNIFLLKDTRMECTHAAIAFGLHQAVDVHATVTDLRQEALTVQSVGL